jgi:hypothetical protein
MDTTELKTRQLGTTGLQPHLSPHLALVERPQRIADTDVDIAEIEGRNS